MRVMSNNVYGVCVVVIEVLVVPELQGILSAVIKCHEIWLWVCVNVVGFN